MMDRFILAIRPITTGRALPSEAPTARRALAGQLRAACPEVVWQASYTSSGPFPFLDVIEAPDEAAAKAAADMLRNHIGGTVELWPIKQHAPFSYDVSAAETGSEESGTQRPDPVTEAHMESFPASDPPSWTP